MLPDIATIIDPRCTNQSPLRARCRSLRLNGAVFYAITPEMER
jgi:hypothetical protein